MGDLILFPLLRRQDQIAAETLEDFGIEVSEEEFNSSYRPAEDFEGTYEPQPSSGLFGPTEGRWVQTMRMNAARCSRCGELALDGWSWVEPDSPAVLRHFTCDDCAEAL